MNFTGLKFSMNSHLNNKFKVKTDMPKCLISNDKINLLSGKKMLSFEFDVSVLIDGDDGDSKTW